LLLGQLMVSDALFDRLNLLKQLVQLATRRIRIAILFFMEGSPVSLTSSCSLSCGFYLPDIAGPTLHIVGIVGRDSGLDYTEPIIFQRFILALKNPSESRMRILNLQNPPWHPGMTYKPCFF
jgi:hypothetical protein